MKKLLAAILIVLVIGVGLIMKQMWDTKVAAAAQRATEERKAIRANDAAIQIATQLEQDRALRVQREQRHELLNSRYHMAQIVWEEVPLRLRFYRSCLDFKLEYGEWATPEYKELDKQLDFEVKILNSEACEARPATAGKCAGKLK